MIRRMYHRPIASLYIYNALAGYLTRGKPLAILKIYYFFLRFAMWIAWPLTANAASCTASDTVG